MGACPTVKAAGVLLFTAGLLGFSTYYLGGWAPRTVFIMTGLVAVVILLIINSYSNERARTRARLVHLQEELAEQHAFLKELSPIETLEECLDFIVENTSDRLRCHRVSIMIPDENQEYLHIAAACGVPKDIISKTRIPIGECVAGRVFHADGPIHVKDAQQKLGRRALPIDSPAFMSGPLMLSGMQWGNARLGVLSVTQPIGRKDFSIDDEFVFSNICEAASVAIYNHLAVAKVQKSNVEFLETLINALEARDLYTRGHSERVSEYSLIVGRRLLMSEESLTLLKTTARLHDIGKIGVPDAVLLKPGKLSEQEWRQIQQHTDIGARMLAQSSIVSSTIDAIRGHHERLDGTGYHGLTRPEIPLMARIVAVADAFDAMTSERPYRKPLSVRQSLSELNRCKNEQFDTACVEALIDAYHAGDLETLLKHQKAHDIADEAPAESEARPIVL